MKLNNRSLLYVATFALAACGTQSNDESNDNNQAPPQQQQTSQQPQQTPQQIPVTRAPSSTPEVVWEDSETRDQSDYSQADTYGVRYDARQTVAYDSQFGSPQYDPNSRDYYQTMQGYQQQFQQPYGQYEQDYQRPYLNDRYQQHRQFLNYQQGFQGVQVGHGQWNQQNYYQTQQYFERSQRWVNVDVYNLIERTLRILQGRNFRSRANHEDRIRDCIRRRDHHGAVRYHDELLREARNHRGHDRNDRDRDGGRHNGRG